MTSLSYTVAVARFAVIAKEYVSNAMTSMFSYSSSEIHPARIGNLNLKHASILFVVEESFAWRRR